jgi:hypothetical protein
MRLFHQCRSRGVSADDLADLHLLVYWDTKADD